MEKKYDNQFKEVFTALRYLINPPEKERRKIGYKRSLVSGKNLPGSTF